MQVSVRADSILIDEDKRLSNLEILDYIFSLKFYKAPKFERGLYVPFSTREVEQHLSNKFSKYIFGIELAYGKRDRTKYITRLPLDSYTFTEPYSECDVDKDNIYYKNIEVIRQPNQSLLTVSGVKQLIVGGNSYTNLTQYMALRVVRAGDGLFRYEEIEEAYQTSQYIKDMCYGRINEQRNNMPSSSDSRDGVN
ncbi:hypothetical protein H6G33_09480 [Calothrix sp. FACHB-1219]|uniref:hypothetical protein n=1 Tax=unclassified Calothrix TaxID=2619626 RepID=UPI001683C714|nr:MULTISPECIES: hypothetical protein [unclassified Calothrix]MBD2201577.1 hypothetical protein [Calothrix sp. FACHB-168]MBD2217263.1 hypothetical protein [Calothrix sp. FACHB-1219]